MKQIHYFYKITNLINKKFYYGIRSCNCLPGKDPYMGSGTYLHRAFRKYGIENFKKEVLRVCKTREDVSDLERWIVTEELVKDPNCYNQRVGGDDSDSFYGRVLCYDKITDMKLAVSIEEYRSNKDRYITPGEGKVSVYNYETNKYELIDKDEYFSNKNKYRTTFSHSSKGLVTVKDKNNNFYQVSVDDPRYLSGELVHIWKGRSHSEVTKDKISKSRQVTSKGERNSHYGTKWMTNPEGISKPIKKELVDEYLSNGWTLGRKMTIKKRS